jgi:hypothetical protein
VSVGTNSGALRKLFDRTDEMPLAWTTGWGQMGDTSVLTEPVMTTDEAVRPLLPPSSTLWASFAPVAGACEDRSALAPTQSAPDFDNQVKPTFKAGDGPGRTRTFDRRIMRAAGKRPGSSFLPEGIDLDRLCPGRSVESGKSSGQSSVENVRRESHHRIMPRLSSFYGIAVFMYWNEGIHARPHFHARYAGEAASVDFDGNVIAGTLPARAQRMVAEWARLHQGELAENWERARNEERLRSIDPLP